MKKLVMALVVAGMAGVLQAQNASAPAAGETLVFGFEDDSWKATGKFDAQNGKIMIAEENATEGKKAMVLEFDRTGKTQSDRPTIRINKAAAFLGAKALLIDYTFVGEVSPKTKIRCTVKATDGTTASAEETLMEGKATMEIDLTTTDANKLDSAKICLDNCASGKGKLFVDNIRIKK
jgi:spermidine/putrescine-binding protein